MDLTANMIAEALEAAAAVFRRHAALANTESPSVSVDALSRARALHPQLGPRQAEIITLLEEVGRDGTNTGVLSRAMDYGQPNVYLTLRGLIGHGLVERDDVTSPHTYRLAAGIMGSRPS